MKFFPAYIKCLRMALKYIDIGANLTDGMFLGRYGGSVKHPEDLDVVLERAWKQGLDKIIVTVGSLTEADEALSLANKDGRLYVTIGCHPTRCDEFVEDPELYFTKLRSKIHENPTKVIAVGECGLDYDRLEFCAKPVQTKYFEKQLSLASDCELPLFLHMRNAFADFKDILDRNSDALETCGGGVVHSFTGTLEEAKSILEYNNLYIGLNGCSLKTQENIDIVKEIPNDRILIETDSPWCGIRPSHASYKYVTTKFPTVKKKEKWSAETLIDGRSEPCQISQVLEAIAGIKEEPIEMLAEQYHQNTIKLFFNRPIR